MDIELDPLKRTRRRVTDMPGFELFDQREIDAVTDVIRRRMVHRYSFNGIRNGIYKVEEFENAVAEMVGSKFCLAVNNGTSALYVGMKGLGLNPGDQVITSAFTFIATIEAMVACGVVPVLADVDENLNLDPDSVVSKITDRTRAIMPVHMFGASADMDGIKKVCDDYGLPMVEDSCEALGATYKGKYAGTFGAWGAYSLDPYKVLTVGEGGLLVTDDEVLYRRMEYAHDHGHAHDKSIDRGAEKKIGLGFNFRMSELEGALGLVQIKKMPDAIAELRSNKVKLMEMVGNIDGLEQRRLTDREGEIATQVVFMLPDAERAKAFQAASDVAGVSCGILADNTWHYAKHWSSLRDWGRRARVHGMDVPLYRPIDMAVTEGILSRTAVYGMNINMDDASLEKMAQAIKAGASAAL